jgi:hypothetical protein
MRELSQDVVHHLAALIGQPHRARKEIVDFHLNQTDKRGQQNPRPAAGSAAWATDRKVIPHNGFRLVPLKSVGLGATFAV